MRRATDAVRDDLDIRDVRLTRHDGAALVAFLFGIFVVWLWLGVA